MENKKQAWSDYAQGSGVYTVKTLYNVTRYNRIFNTRYKIAGNGSVSIKIPSLKQNIHLTTQEQIYNLSGI